METIERSSRMNFRGSRDSGIYVSYVKEKVLIFVTVWAIFIVTRLRTRSLFRSYIVYEFIDVERLE